MKTANASLPFVLNYTHLDFTLFLKKYQVLTGCPRKILLDTALMHLSASQKCHCLQREVAWAHCPDTCPHGTGRAGVQWFFSVVSSQSANVLERNQGSILKGMLGSTSYSPTVDIRLEEFANNVESEGG